MDWFPGIQGSEKKYSNDLRSSDNMAPDWETMETDPLMEGMTREEMILRAGTSELHEVWVWYHAWRNAINMRDYRDKKRVRAANKLLLKRKEHYAYRKPEDDPLEINDRNFTRS